jgi:hypothetical protein
MDDLVGANAGEAGIFDCRIDDVFVSLIEVQNTLRLRLEIGLRAEAHNDKTATHNILRSAGRGHRGSRWQSMVASKMPHKSEPERV